MKTNNIYYILFIICVLTSCDSFLKDYSQDLSYANNVNDLSELLAGDGYVNTQGELYGDINLKFIHMMDDDIDYMILNAPGTNVASPFYYWVQNPFVTNSGQPTTDYIWKWFYKKIGTLNAVIAKVEDFKSDDEAGYHRIKGEAHFLRGFYYFWLVNLYAKPYSPASASEDPGVPLKLTEKVEDKHYSRTSVSETYKAVTTDLILAAEHLKGVKQPSIYRANETAVHVLLSRVYLYMCKWESALEECNEALKGNYELKNFNTLKEGDSATNSSSPEIIFSMGENQISTSLGSLMMSPDHYAKPKYSYFVTSDLMNLYDENENDLRTGIFFFYPAKKHIPMCQKLKEEDIGMVSDRFLIRLPEVYLNQAEALAMLDRPSEAATALKKLRDFRFKQGTSEIITETGKDMITFIRDERRRELCFEAHRWFDLRRYAVNPKHPKSHTISHAYYEWDINSLSPVLRGLYVLNNYTEDIGAYMLPIPDYAIIFNDGILVPNDERPNRNYK